MERSGKRANSFFVWKITFAENWKSQQSNKWIENEKKKTSANRTTDEKIEHKWMLNILHLQL